MKKHPLHFPALIAGILLVSTVIKAQPAKQQYSLSGYIKDATTGEVLIGATVYLVNRYSGTSTNGYGYYMMMVPEGTHRIAVSFIGYNTVEKELTFTRNTRLDIELTPTSKELEAVTVTREKKNANVSSRQMSVTRLNIKQLREMPALLGEVDIIKSIQLLPGVQSAAEGSSGFNVRGGATDHNLILLDDATVYNASHLMGFFSVFNNDAIKDITLYKGDMPASMGGRLASVLDIRMKDGNSKHFGASGGIGSISSRLTLEGPIVKDKSSFILSGRRTYIDLFFPLFKGADLNSSVFYFYDFNAKVNFTLNPNNRFYASGYFGKDLFGAETSQFGFGNQTLTLRWNHIFGNRLFMNTSVVKSRYSYNLESKSNDANAFKWNSTMDELAMKINYTLIASERLKIRFGVSSSYLTFNPGVVTGNSDNSFITRWAIPRNFALEHGLYLANEQTMGKFTLKYGLRLSIFQNIGKGTVLQLDDAYRVTGSKTYASGTIFNTYINPEPRIGAIYQIDEKNSLKASYGRTVQYIQRASNSQTGNPLDVWFPASPNIKPQKSDQWAIGYFRNFLSNSIETSLEVYYKKLDHLIDFKDFATLLLNDEMEADVRSGSGYSYGAELYARYRIAKFNGWVSYTYSRAFRTIIGVNQNKQYRSNYDKPHSISVVVNYPLTKRTTLSAIWIYSTGQPFTPPIGRFEINGTIIPIYADRNGKRFPSYHRLDLSLVVKSKKRPKRKWRGKWNISIYNAYNRHNAWAINFVRDEENFSETYAEKTYLFPIIISTTYNFKF